VLVVVTTAATRVAFFKGGNEAKSPPIPKTESKQHAKPYTLNTAKRRQEEYADTTDSFFAL